MSSIDINFRESAGHKIPAIENLGVAKVFKPPIYPRHNLFSMLTLFI